jgi:hypothetical protein
MNPRVEHLNESVERVRMDARSPARKASNSRKHDRAHLLVWQRGSDPAGVGSDE